MLITKDDGEDDFYNRTRGVCGQNIIGDTIDSNLVKPPHLFECIALLMQLLISNSNVTGI